MNDDLRAYQEYKDSGLAGLGKVPAHWDVRRNGRLFAQRHRTGFGDLPILEVTLKTGGPADARPDHCVEIGVTP